MSAVSLKSKNSEVEFPPAHWKELEESKPTSEEEDKLGKYTSKFFHTMKSHA